MSTVLGQELIAGGSLVRVVIGSQNWTHPETHSVPVEQFLAMLRFEQRDKVADLVCEAELPIDLNRSGRDDCT